MKLNLAKRWRYFCRWINRDNGWHADFNSNLIRDKWRIRMQYQRSLERRNRMAGGYPTGEQP